MPDSSRSVSRVENVDVCGAGKAVTVSEDFSSRAQVGMDYLSKANWLVHDGLIAYEFVGGIEVRCLKHNSQETY